MLNCEQTFCAAAITYGFTLLCEQCESSSKVQEWADVRMGDQSILLCSAEELIARSVAERLDRFCPILVGREAYGEAVGTN